MWDTTSVPDGTYFIKIAASDAPSNSPGTALTGELESVSFDIDNSPPRIEIQPVRASPRTLTFVVRDDHSAVQRVEYSLDASRWRVVYPKDGIPDSRREEFEIAVEEPRPAAASSSAPPTRCTTSPLPSARRQELPRTSDVLVVRGALALTVVWARSQTRFTATAEAPRGRARGGRGRRHPGARFILWDVARC